MDRYIDVWEVTEYGNHFAGAVQALVGVCPFIDIVGLATFLKSRQSTVEEERTKAGLTRSLVRTDSGRIGDEVDEARGTLRRFYGYLSSLDPRRVKFELGSFFRNGKLGDLGNAKAADVASRLEWAIKGFEAGGNQGVDAAGWKAELVERQSALVGHLGDHSASDGDKRRQTKALGQAWNAFLDAWYGVAKPAVSAALSYSGRSEEFRIFFKDHQVHEGGTPSSAPTETVPTEDREMSAVFWWNDAVLMVRGRVSRLNAAGEFERVAEVGASTTGLEGPFVSADGKAVFMHGGNDCRLSIVDLKSTPSPTRVLGLPLATSTSPVMTADETLVYAHRQYLIAVQVPVAMPEPGRWATQNGDFRNSRCVGGE